MQSEIPRKRLRTLLRAGLVFPCRRRSASTEFKVQSERPFISGQWITVLPSCWDSCGDVQVPAQCAGPVKAEAVEPQAGMHPRLAAVVSVVSALPPSRHPCVECGARRHRRHFAEGRRTKESATSGTWRRRYMRTRTPPIGSPLCFLYKSMYRHVP